MLTGCRGVGMYPVRQVDLSQLTKASPLVICHAFLVVKNSETYAQRSVVVLGENEGAQRIGR